ncbi:MAG: 4-hydroxymandelate oxidase [Legionellaceae bacterium]
MQLVNLDDFENLAQTILSKDVFEFYAGGAADEITLERNKNAFTEISLIPSILKDTTFSNTKVNMLGIELETPIMGAPTAFQCLVDPMGEIAIAQALREEGLAAIISTMATTSLEEVVSVSQCPSWFQLYMYKDRSISLNLIKRAENAGYKGIVLTVDVPIMGKRERDIRNQFCLPPHIYPKNFQENLANLSYKTPGSTIKNYTDRQFDRSLSWKDIEWLKTQLSIPLILKGIMRPDDAVKALDYGADAIIVSNHGGRQLDGVPSSIELLSDIAEKIAGKFPILIDGGIRRGTDILKAIALGASCVLIGRPLLWGLAANGKQGVVDMLKILKEEFLEAMILCSYQQIKDVQEDKDLIKWHR